MTVAVDAVLITVSARDLHVLVHRRLNPPCEGDWALPGMFIRYPAKGEDEVLRSLREKAGLEFHGYLERLDWSWEPGRDERGWVGTFSYLALCPSAVARVATKERDDVALARVLVPWAGEVGGPAEIFIDDKRVKLAFDHEALIGSAVKRLRGKLRYTGIGLELMPETFTLRSLQRVYETILGEKLNRLTFRRLVTEVLGLVEPTGEFEEDVEHRPAELFRRARGSTL